MGFHPMEGTDVGWVWICTMYAPIPLVCTVAKGVKGHGTNLTWWHYPHLTWIRAFTRGCIHTAPGSGPLNTLVQAMSHLGADEGTNVWSICIIWGHRTLKSDDR